LDAHGEKRSGTTRTGSAAAVLVADIFAPTASGNRTNSQNQ